MSPRSDNLTKFTSEAAEQVDYMRAVGLMTEPQTESSPGQLGAERYVIVHQNTGGTSRLFISVNAELQKDDKEEIRKILRG